jgi:hypothetical protein
LTLRVEVRGGGAQGKIPSQTTFEKKVNASPYSHWTSLSLTGGEYKKLGDLTAWRVSVWDGEQLLGEQKSFLW